MPPFSHEVKLEIHEEQGGKCLGCDKPIESTHHSLPEVYGGLSIRENGMGVCHECHEVLDKWSLDYGITVFGPLNEIPDEFFRKGNPFKEISTEEMKTMNREQLIPIAKRHKKHRR